jgi:hypothetical protein
MRLPAFPLASLFVFHNIHHVEEYLTEIGRYLRNKGHIADFEG